MTGSVALVTGSSLPEDTLAQLRAAGLEIVFMGKTIDEAAVLAHVARHKVSVVVLRGPAPLTPKVFEAAKDLRIIAKYGAGIDSVDVASATAHGVAVMITAGSNAAAVAEHSLALMLALTRELPRFDRQIRSGGWKDQSYLVRDFSERTVGIVGYGQIGRRTAALAAAFGARVVIYSRTRGAAPQDMQWETDLDRLVARVDILSLHCPLTDKTRGMIGKKQLALMKPEAIIVNTARGQLIDEAALAEALKAGRLAGAGLDVFEQEPSDPNNPLFQLPNVLCTPHVGSTTTGASAQMGVILTQNVLCWLRGEVYDSANFMNPQVMKGRAAAGK